jgi:hypothetical protein
MLAKPNRNDDTREMLGDDVTIDSKFSRDARTVVFAGDCLELPATVPNHAVQLVENPRACK